MLAKKYRLPIQSVLNRSGRTFRSRSFLIKLFLNHLDFNRFGVVISKKVDKRAVKRNWLKRLVLDFAKKFVLVENNNKPPHPTSECGGKFDVLIIFSPVVAKMKKADIIKELEEALEKII